ncbi:MAG: plasmid pRiA4b ORF-3 family protein [Candidatus Riflebacteria bacterium]
MEKREPQKFYLINLELMEIKPTVWRRFVVPADISLDRLHDVIQIIMGWQDGHMHEFNFGKQRYVETIDEEFDDEMTMLEATERLNKHFKKKGDKCLYVYDFGDSWMHQLTLENANYKLADDDWTICCKDGENACPPEDIGGPPGYEEFLKILKNSKHEEHKSMLALSTTLQPGNKKFNPKLFDLEMINNILSCFLRWTRPRQLD